MVWAREREYAVAMRQTALTYIRLSLLYFGRKAAHHKDWNNCDAMNGPAIFFSIVTIGDVSRMKNWATTRIKFPRKIGIQIKKPQNAGARRVFPSRGDETVPSADISTSSRPGREVEIKLMIYAIKDAILTADHVPDIASLSIVGDAARRMIPADIISGGVFRALDNRSNVKKYFRMVVWLSLLLLFGAGGRCI